MPLLRAFSNVKTFPPGVTPSGSAVQILRSNSRILLTKGRNKDLFFFSSSSSFLLCGKVIYSIDNFLKATFCAKGKNAVTFGEYLNFPRTIGSLESQVI